MTVPIEVFAVTHIGNHRKNNEDNFYIGKFISPDEQQSMTQAQNLSIYKSISFEETLNRIFAVSDGMGGHENGEIASFITVDMLNSFSEAQKTNRCGKKKEKFFYIQAFQEAVGLINQKVNEHPTDNNTVNNMGATLSGIIVFKNEIVPFNIGDSSVYIIENNTINKLTRDDNEASLFGNPGNQRISTTGKRLTKYIGLPTSYGILTATISPPVLLKTGQIYLIATDGLTDNLSQDEILNVITGNNINMEMCANALLNESLGKANGGRDNITIVMLKIKSNSRKKGV